MSASCSTSPTTARRNATRPSSSTGLEALRCAPSQATRLRSHGHLQAFAPARHGSELNGTFRMGWLVVAVTDHIDNVSIGRTDEKPPHTPRLVSEWVDYLV